MPDGIKAVNNFEVNKYLGQWYEIARLDHAFERDLSHVTATYSLREGGGLQVINKGFNQAKGQWSEAQGKAFFVDGDDKGHLKVSFFGPFYGAYIIFHLDNYYQQALVTSNDRSYFWLLSRTPTISNTLKQRLLTKAAEAGFDTQSFIFVEQAKPTNTQAIEHFNHD